MGDTWNVPGWEPLCHALRLKGFIHADERLKILPLILTNGQLLTLVGRN